MVSYGDQFNENFGQSVGLSLNVLIYNNYCNNIVKEWVCFNIISVEVSVRQVIDQLKIDVQIVIISFWVVCNVYQVVECLL